MYCGNNAKDPDLLSGKKALGTSYDCFRRGVGVGKHLPRSELEVEYEAIHRNNIFCGKNFGPEQEAKYDRMGSPSECLRKGVGVGKGLARKSLGLDRKKPKVKPGRRQHSLEETAESGVPPSLKPKFGGTSPKFGFGGASVWPKRFLAGAVGLGIGFIISFAALWLIKPGAVKKDGKRSVLKITLYSLLLGLVLALSFLLGSAYFLK